VKWVDAPPETKDVAALVRATAAQAKASHRRLVVYVGASWCEPCQAIHQAAASGKLDLAFPDLEVLAFDLDRDREALDQAGYASDLIPLFAVPLPEGRAGPRRAQGGLKRGDNVTYLTDKLRTLLSG